VTSTDFGQHRGRAWLSLSLALALACSACAAPPGVPTPTRGQSAPAPQVPCADAVTQLELSACWAQEARRIEAEVASRFRQVAQALQLRSDGASSQALADSQAWWERYRDAACEVHRQQAAGASLQTSAVGVCRWRLAHERLAELDRVRPGTAAAP